MRRINAKQSEHERSIDGRTERNIEPFRIGRAILQLENPPANYMV